MTSSETPIEPEARVTSPQVEPVGEPADPVDPADAASADAADDAADDAGDDAGDNAGDNEGARGDAALARAPEPAPVALAVRRSPVLLVVAGMCLAIGWVFIVASHRFHVTVPVVVLSLGWLAVVSAAYFLFRTGATATDVDPDEAVWWRPTGKRDELEREKVSLLKAIKEIEFDREMGKMSQADAAEILRVYRAHAIEVIKAIDHVDEGGPASVRDEIEREVRARMAVGAGSKKGKAKAQDAKAKAAKAAKQTAEAGAKPEAKAGAKPDGGKGSAT